MTGRTEMLNSIATILATRSVEGVWQFYVSKMTDWGFPHIENNIQTRFPAVKSNE